MGYYLETILTTVYENECTYKNALKDIKNFNLSIHTEQNIAFGIYLIIIRVPTWDSYLKINAYLYDNLINTVSISIGKPPY